VDTERRNTSRLAYEVAARLFRDGAPKTSPGIKVRTVDLAMSGVCLESPEPVAVGESFELEFTLERGDMSSEPLRLGARAVWGTSVPGGVQVGAAFHSDLPALTLTRLDVLLKFLRGELSLPGRR
jgi:hypothetical protein